MKSKTNEKLKKKIKSKKGGNPNYSLYKILREYKIAKDIDKKYRIPLAERKQCLQVDPIDTAVKLKKTIQMCKDPLIKDHESYKNYCLKVNPFLISNDTKYLCFDSYTNRFLILNKFYFNESLNRRQQAIEKDMKKIKARQNLANDEAIEDRVSNNQYKEMNQFFENILKKGEEQLKNLQQEHIDRHILLNLFISPQKQEILQDLYNGDKDEMTKDINELLYEFNDYIIGDHTPIKKEDLFF
jgi:hypothetical protein